MFDKVSKQYFSNVRYFKTIPPAFYRRQTPYNYTGKWLRYHENGRVENECHYANGERIGRWITLSEDGEKEVDYDYDKHPRSTCSCVIS